VVLASLQESRSGSGLSMPCTTPRVTEVHAADLPLLISFTVCRQVGLSLVLLVPFVPLLAHGGRSTNGLVNGYFCAMQLCRKSGK
jgi:hypothetical protein